MKELLKLVYICQSYTIQEESRPLITAANSHIFLLRHIPFSRIYSFNIKYSKILDSWIAFRSNRLVINYSIQPEILHIRAALVAIAVLWHYLLLPLRHLFPHCFDVVGWAA